MKWIILGLLLLAGLTTQAQILNLRVSQEGSPIFCGDTKVYLEIGKKHVILKSAKYSLDLKVIKGNKKQSEMKAVDPRGNVYIIDAWEYADKQYKLTIAPQIDYLFKYEIANVNLCDETSNR